MCGGQSAGQCGGGGGSEGASCFSVGGLGVKGLELLRCVCLCGGGGGVYTGGGALPNPPDEEKRERKRETVSERGNGPNRK